MTFMKDAAQSRPKPLVAIVGPTGIGKTTLSVMLAGKLNGEIVSADSRLFYRGMDIGTDKPSAEDREKVRHHLIDICNPDQTISLGKYKKLAMAAVEQVHSRDALPLLVGGTGQYVTALIEGWQIPEVPPNERLREQLGRLEQSELEQRLIEVDPISAGRIDQRNKRRVIRALEVTLISGKPFSAYQEKIAPDFSILTLGLNANRDEIYERADRRVDEMMAKGLLGEVIGLRDRGYNQQYPSMSGLGYKQLLAYLDDECTLDEAVDRIKFETHRFVRQQMNWFRVDDERIKWFETAEKFYAATIFKWVSNWLEDMDFFVDYD